MSLTELVSLDFFSDPNFWLVVILTLFIMLFLVVIVIFGIFIAGFICVALAGLNIAAGILCIKGLASNHVKRIKSFSLLGIIVNTIVAGTANYITAVMPFGAEGNIFSEIILLAIAVISTIAAFVNAICYGNAKQIKENK